MLTGLGRRLMWASLAMLLVAVGLFRVWVHNDAVQTGYQLSEEMGRRTELVRLRQQLEVELASEKSLDHLSRLAVKLGLVPPGAEQVLAASPAKDAKERR